MSTGEKDGRRVYDKKNSCYYCEKEFGKLGQHLFQVHKNEKEVDKIIALYKNDRMRQLEMDKLCRLGELKVMQRPAYNKDKDPFNYLPCQLCHSFFQKNDLYQHCPKCPFAQDRSRMVRSKKLQHAGRLLLAANKIPTGASQQLYNMLSIMAMDDVSAVVKTDETILRVGSTLIESCGNEKAVEVLQQMRTLARLLIKVRELCSVPTLSLEKSLTSTQFDNHLRQRKISRWIHSQLNRRIERVQRRATKWMLRIKTGEIPYKQQLMTLKLLPLTYDREIKDLVFFYKTLYGHIDLKMDSYVSFIEHRCTRHSQAAGVVLQTPLCRTTTFQSSYYNWIIKPWNCICKDVHPDTFSSSISFKNYLKRKYTELVKSVYDVELSCTWSLILKLVDDDTILSMTDVNSYLKANFLPFIISMYTGATKPLTSFNDFFKLLVQAIAKSELKKDKMVQTITKGKEERIDYLAFVLPTAIDLIGRAVSELKNDEDRESNADLIEGSLDGNDDHCGNCLDNMNKMEERFDAQIQELEEMHDQQL
ncbi:Hypothetical predicted protein [Paramuricea clavata]|uniref:Uncharacterized protein n=1 Tax=Paramuricea clavata TaxID=317549 RepID=A0A6S7I233_PARCT|nr:Hypothetical predicted protein [Paramuricea clavata]